jgi:arsenate reductase
MLNGKHIVLILCTGNSCRSQMAEGFLRAYQGDRYDVHSAGTEPRPEVHPLAVRVMGEVGIDISGHRPKSLSLYLGRAPVRHVVIVCDRARKTCPRIWPFAMTQDYRPFDDPAEFDGAEHEALDTFRRVRDEIGEAMRVWEPVLTAEPKRASPSDVAPVRRT